MPAFFYQPNNLLEARGIHTRPLLSCNLLDNAIKYSLQEADITIRGRKQVNQLIISITDQGIGIAHERIKHLFHSHRSADATVSSLLLVLQKIPFGITYGFNKNRIPNPVIQVICPCYQHQ